MAGSIVKITKITANRMMARIYIMYGLKIRAIQIRTGNNKCQNYTITHSMSIRS